METQINTDPIESSDDIQECRTINGEEYVGHPEALDYIQQSIARQRAAVDAARPALKTLVEAMAQKTGQSHHLRELLFSMWNGKPAPLIDVVHLDFELRQALCPFIQAWGYGTGDWEFFYDELRHSITDAGLWDWFLEESDNLKTIKEYAARS